eukprot:scaffold138428_cov50-Tisochrysis_lutea.AAC.1
MSIASMQRSRSRMAPLRRMSTAMECSLRLSAHEGMKVFAEAIATGALHHLEHLKLFHNIIGCEGMSAFVDAIFKGALQNLEHLELYCNKIDEKGMRAFAEALSKGALKHLKTLVSDKFEIRDDASTLAPNIR